MRGTRHFPSAQEIVREVGSVAPCCVCIESHDFRGAGEVPERPPVADLFSAEPAALPLSPEDVRRVVDMWKVDPLFGRPKRERRDTRRKVRGPSHPFQPCIN